MDRQSVLPQRLAALAEERPDVLAVVDVGGRSQTWAGFHTECLRWAAAYRAIGVAEGDPVVTMLPNSFEAYHTWIGAAWLRAIEVPANNMYRAHMLQYLLNNSDAAVLVIAQRFVDRLEAIAADMHHLRTVVVVDAAETLPDLPFEVVRGEDLLASVAPAEDLRGPDPWDTAALLYTSGTTGPSKGVIVPWGEIHQSPAMLPEDFVGEGDSYYTMYPAFHLSGKCGVCNAAHAKAHLVVRETLSVTEFWDDIRSHDVRSAGLLGSIAAMLMTMPPREDDADNPLERVVMGPVISNIDDFKARFGVKHVTTGFGMTEIGFPIAAPWDPPNPRTCGRRRMGPPHYEIKIADEHDHDVPVGTVGELLVRARDPWVMNGGYWKAPELTARSWRNGWFHTGDAFVEDADGWLYFVDRMKDALRRRGENISSFEVEAGVLQHPAVAEVAVVGVPSEFGEDEVKAIVVRRPEHPLDPEELIEFLVPRMPRFMIPRYVEFVDALPKTDGTFRVRKHELREQMLTEATWDREAAGVVLPKD